MRRKYKYSPINEAVCEFRLSPEIPWDMTFPGLLFGAAKSKFPEKEQIPDLPSSPIVLSHGQPQKLKLQSNKISFYTKDRKGFIQVGNHTVSIHRLKPYPNWEDFKPDIKFIFNEVVNLIGDFKLQRIGLRYINKIEIPEATINLSDYFQFLPSFGNDLKPKIKTFVIGCEDLCNEDKDVCRFQMNPNIQERPGHSNFTLDIDYFTMDGKELTDVQPLEWIELAHQKIGEVFEGCITDKMREIF